MSSAMMTMLGVLGGMVATAQGTLPADSPQWIQMVLAALSAVLSVYLGKTHKGTK